jgi:hypothetical protein
MHFDGDLYAVLGSELPVLGPVGLDYFVPLPIEYVWIVGRPWAGDPVGSTGLQRIARTS